MKVHRWQPTGYAPCGRALSLVRWNEGREYDDGVTCVACKRNPTRTSIMRPHPLMSRESGTR